MTAGLGPLAKNPAIAQRDGDPAGYIIAALGVAKTMLPHMLDGDIRQLVELRADAEAIRLHIRSAGLGRAAELDATEIVRRAERGIALKIREGQAAGTIRSPRSHIGNQYSDSHDDGRIPPTEYATKGELMGGGGDSYGGSKPGYYHLADGVTDSQFEEAIEAARAEGLLTRMNLYRRLQPVNGNGWIPDALDRGGEASLRRRAVIREMAAEGHSSRQISERLGTLDGTVRKIARESGIDIPADRTVVKTLRHNNDRIVEETTHILDGAAMSLRLVSPSELDPASVKDWVASLTTSTRAINRFIRHMKATMKETTSDHHQD